MSYYVIHDGAAAGGAPPPPPTQYTLTMVVSPVGSGTTSPSVGVHTYDAGTIVNVSAAPLPGYTFDHWEDDLTGSTNPTTITMNSNKLVTAVFAVEVPPTTYTLTMAVDPVVGGTTSPSVGVHTYAANTVVTISATAAPDYAFSHWSGDVTGSTNPTSITMDSDKSVTANFSSVCAECDNRNEATPATWQVVISGCTGQAAVWNGTWTVTQVPGTPCLWRYFVGSPGRYVWVSVGSPGKVTVYGPAGYPGAAWARWSKSNVGCAYSGTLDLEDPTGGAAGWTQNSVVTVTSITA